MITIISCYIRKKKKNQAKYNEFENCYSKKSNHMYIRFFFRKHSNLDSRFVIDYLTSKTGIMAQYFCMHTHADKTSGHDAVKFTL